MVATDARLTLALYALWPWLLLDDPAMEAVLELLCVYTANCTAGLFVYVASVCASYVFMQALCLVRACPSPPSAVSNLTESHTFSTEGPIVLSSDR